MTWTSISWIELKPKKAKSRNNVTWRDVKYGPTERVNKWTKVFINASMYFWMDGWIGEWNNKRVNTVSECMDEGRNEWMNEGMHEWMGRCMKERSKGCVNEWLTVWMAEFMHRWLDGWKGGWMDEWMDGWMGAWVGGWTEGWRDGWMSERMNE